jgi:hypothetical protein
LRVAAVALSAAGCASDAPTERGQVQGQPYSKGEWLQSDGNRITQVAMRANQVNLILLADKLAVAIPAHGARPRPRAKWLDGINPQHVYNVACDMAIALPDLLMAPFLAFLPVR